MLTGSIFCLSCFDLHRIIPVSVPKRIPKIFQVKADKPHALVLLPVGFFMQSQALVVDALGQDEDAKGWKRDASKAGCTKIPPHKGWSWPDQMPCPGVT